MAILNGQVERIISVFITTYLYADVSFVLQQNLDSIKVSLPGSQVERSNLQTVQRIDISFGGYEQLDDLIVTFVSSTVQWGPQISVPAWEQVTQQNK